MKQSISPPRKSSSLLAILLTLLLGVGLTLPLVEMQAEEAISGQYTLSSSSNNNNPSTENVVPVGTHLSLTAIQNDPISVTLAGNLQTSLGCPKNWQPDCAATHLTAQGNAVWRGVFTVSMGSWEYKVALNDTWDESYAGNHVANGNTILELAAETSVRFYYDHKTKAVLDSVMDKVAVVAGDFQSELGCTGDNNGDWQPWCVRSLMTDVNGDGLYVFETASLPTGNYQFKVALNEAWDIAYPNDNLSFSVAQAGDKVSITWNMNDNQVAVNITPAFNPADLAQAPATHPIQDEVLYFVMPDRFYNGSVDNDDGGIVGDISDHGFDPTHKGYFHGGDLAGLVQKMDYLAEMGVTAIWMTPVFKNRPVQGSGNNASAGYHGYWITDFTQFDPHFGSNAELELVITEAHSRGIKIFFDIITNHTADIIKYQEGQYSYRSKTDYPYKTAAGEDFDDRNFINSSDFPSLTTSVSFPYTPIFEDAADATIKVPTWLNNPIYYHNRGDSTFSGENSLYGDFFGLDDLFTEHPAVVQGMTDIYKDWITNYDIDGFRVDTTKHVNLEFWQSFMPDILAHAEAQGKPNFFVFGEIFSGNPVLLSHYVNQADIPAVLDFKFQERVRAYVSQGVGSDTLKDVFETDDYFITPDTNAYALPTFIGNHDRGRIGYFLYSDNDNLSDNEALARSKMAHALMYFARGVPVVYYGDEQGFVGDGGDQDARQDMFASQVASYNDDDLIGTDATTADQNFDQTHPLYQALKTYAALYDTHKALRYGAQIQRYSNSEPGLLVFSRIDRDEKVEYLIAFNSYTSTKSMTVPTYVVNMNFTAIYTGNDNGVALTLNSDADKQIFISVPGVNFVIYQAEAAISPETTASIAARASAFPLGTSATPNITFSDLTDNQEVNLAVQEIDGNSITERLEVKAELDQAIFAEVTFAVRPNGSTDYTVIGVDNNPPYRVFYDTSKLSETPLNFIAIVYDVVNGTYNSVTVNGIVPKVVEPDTTYPYAIIHYLRGDGDYGDHTTGDYNDFWGLHLWGDAIDPTEVTDWTAPKPFLGQTDYGQFAWVRLQDSSKDVNFIVHRGDTKDGTDQDRKFNPETDGPEIWLKQDDGQFYTTQADAQGYAIIRYQRPDGNYQGWGLHLWTEAGPFSEWADGPIPFDGVDDYGAYKVISLAAYAQFSDTTKALNFIVRDGEGNKDVNPDRSFIPADYATIWLKSGDERVYTSRGHAENFATLHYRRAQEDYGDYGSSNFNDYWGLHVWEDVVNGPTWETAFKPAYTDTFGVAFRVQLISGAKKIGYILHKGDEKDPGPDQFLTLADNGYEVWQLQGADAENAPYIRPVPPPTDKPTSANGDLSKYQAHWLTEDTLAWPIEPQEGYTYALYYAANGGLSLDNDGVSGATGIIPLSHQPDGLSEALKTKWPHLANYAAFIITDTAMVKDALQGQLAIVAETNSDGTKTLVNATGLQTPGVLDDLYYYDGPLGLIYDGDTPSLRLWAPTAKSVKLHRYEPFTDTTEWHPRMHSMLPEQATQIITMTAGQSGTWHITGDASWTGHYYLYEVEVYVHSTGQVEHNMVTDPYALGLSLNSRHSLFVNLDAPALKPDGWDGLKHRALAAPEDISLYELHLRDFSAHDQTVPEAHRGKYTAFTQIDSDGMRHLKNLAEAGLTHLHLLPVFDIATINEDPSQRQEPNVPTGVDPASDKQREAIQAVRDQDAYNWGYDPFHYTVPEGSYASNAQGTARILEFRQMVQALNQTGLRLVMDVVYNHTNSSGQEPNSVLDKVVPGYYHRLDADGRVTTSTCCQNTATEHKMMEKLMIDSLIVWAEEYKVAGFRFDLMGHHLVDNMEAVQSALNDVDPSIYIYGEGWNFGEVQDGARGQNATQLNLAGTGIGTFNDRIRDAARGGGPFDSGEDMIRNQGFINGAFYGPNFLVQGQENWTETQKAELLLSADQIRVGLAGNLADYEFVDHTGQVVTGAMVDYNGAPAGYTKDPQEHIAYVSAHDNQTLYDISAFKMPTDTVLTERVRVQNMGIDLSVLAQGLPFFHAGVDMLRSKSLERDSYNSGDWFNKLDFTYMSNNFGVGLPVEAGGDEDLMKPFLSDPNLKPDQVNVKHSVTHLQEMLAIRRSSKLFRLETAEDIQARLAFHNTGPNQLPGLIVMSLSDVLSLTQAAYPVGTTPSDLNLDPAFERIVVLFNANDEAHTFTESALVGVNLHLHPVQAASGYDRRVKEARYDSATGTFHVPARTTAVFVQLTVVETVVPVDSDSSLSHENHLGISTTIEIPAGAVSKSIKLSYSQLTSPTTSSLIYTGHAFALDAIDPDTGKVYTAYTFLKPITVGIHYQDDDLHGALEETLKVYYANAWRWTTGGEWVDAATTCDPTSTYHRDTVNNILQVALCHLTDFRLDGSETVDAAQRVYLPLVVK